MFQTTSDHVSHKLPMEQQTSSCSSLTLTKQFLNASVGVTIRENAIGINHRIQMSHETDG